MNGVRPLLAAALLVFAIVLLPFATGGWTALPAPGWLAVLTALAAMFALRPDRAPVARLDLPIAAGFGVAAAAAHLHPGLVVGHDVYDHVWGAWAYLQAWHAGDGLPVWLHHLGLGQPMPLFYGPLPFWIMAPFALAGGGPVGMLSGSLTLASVVAAVAAWSAVVRWTNHRRAALVAALALAFAPYRLFDANYRMALGEAWAIALMPFALYACERLLAGGTRGRFARAALAVAALGLAHPLSLVLLAVVLAALAGCRLARSAAGGEPARAARDIATSALATLTGLGLAGFFVVPLVVESGFLPLRRSIGPLGHESFADQGVRPIELLARRLWDRLDFSLAEGNPETRFWPEQPYYFGLVLLAVLLGTALLGRRFAPRESPRAELAVVGGVCVALSTLGVARLAVAVPGLALLQFPWRFLGPASVAAALLAGLLIPVLEARRAHRMPSSWPAIALALALLADGFPFSGAVARLASWDGLAASSRFASGARTPAEIPRPWPFRVHGPIFPPGSCCADVALTNPVYREYFLPSARAHAMHLAATSVGLHVRLGPRHWLRRLDAEPYARREEAGQSAQALVFERRAGRIDVALPDRRGGRVVVTEQYFPGWQVDVGGGWQEVVPTDAGLLAAALPSGVDRVRFRFHRWRWDRSLGWLTTASSAILLATLVRRRRAVAAGTSP